MTLSARNKQHGRRSLFALMLLLTTAALLRGAAPPAPITEAWLEKQVAELGADDFADRQEASRKLAGAGSIAVPNLLKALKSTNIEIRRRAMPLLKRAETNAAKFFENLGASVQWSEDKVNIVSFLQRDASKLRDEDLRELIGLPWLTRVFLNDAPIGDAGLWHLRFLTGLDYLDLAGTKVTDTGLRHLSGLTNLETLRLPNTKVTGSGLVHLKQLRKLEALILYQTRLTDTGLTKGAPGLLAYRGPLVLDLGETQVTGRGLASLRGIRYTISLGLDNTRMTTCDIALLKRLPGLVFLDLSKTNIGDEAIVDLAEMQTLVHLRLGETKVTATGLRKLLALPKLEHLGCQGLKLKPHELNSILDAAPKRLLLWHTKGQDFGRREEKR